ncbi:hypothetical protein BJX64DRAFT_50173 [Aspergillus heterothallicus]
MHLLRIITLVVLFQLGASVPISEPINVHFYGDLNCQDTEISTIVMYGPGFNNEFFWGGQTLASFRLSRPLKGQEQLDISGPARLGEWITSGEHTKDKACAKWQTTFFAGDAGIECQTLARPFTCANIWNNPGL